MATYRTDSGEEKKEGRQNKKTRGSFFSRDLGGALRRVEPVTIFCRVLLHRSGPNMFFSPKRTETEVEIEIAMNMQMQM